MHVFNRAALGGLFSTAIFMLPAHASVSERVDKSQFSRRSCDHYIALTLLRYHASQQWTMPLLYPP